MSTSLSSPGLHPAPWTIWSAHDLIPVLIDLGQLVAGWTAAHAEGRKLRASIHLDTGMNRTGFDRQETERLIGDLTPLESLDIVHVMSHLACADDPETDQNTRQLAAFQDLRSVLAMGRASLANTPGIALGPDYHFDHVRPGVGLYGADPSPDRSRPSPGRPPGRTRAAGPVR